MDNFIDFLHSLANISRSEYFALITFILAIVSIILAYVFYCGDNSGKIHQAQFGNKPLRHQKTVVINDRKAKLYRSGNELISRLLADRCELCGSNDDVQGHHIRKLKDVKEKYQGRKQIRNWVHFMTSRSRKVVFFSFLPC